jgi:hypothetical protein
MKKNILFLCFGLAAGPLAHADSRLFPTDILNQGEVDTQVSINHQRNSSDINSLADTGTQSQRLTAESVQGRYGLGGNWQVGASLNYQTEDTAHTDYSSPPAHFVQTSSDRWRNPAFWATYGLINDKTNPFSLNGELLVSPDVTSTPTSYVARLSSGWRDSDTLRLYATYSAKFVIGSNNADSNSIAIGAYQDISDSVTLIPHASYTRFNATSTFSSQTQYGAGLSADIQIFKGTYLIPDVSFYKNSSRNTKDGLFHADGASGTSINLALYHLY